MLQCDMIVEIATELRRLWDGFDCRNRGRFHQAKIFLINWSDDFRPHWPFVA
jgi:hypothetical protein